MDWPAYFQPLTPAAPLGAISESAAQAVCLLDAFYLVVADCAPELIAVVGLDGGGLRAIRAEDIQTLPDALQRQLRAALVSRRGGLRTIRADQLLLFMLDSIEQREMSGLNDAVLLFGRACASLDRLLDTVEISALNHAGSLTVGRLDLLHGYAQGFAHVWRNPEAPADYLTHLFLPAGSLSEVERGRALALVYPMFDSDAATALHRADNTNLVMRLIYDVLQTLQRDLVYAKSKHVFATDTLPVPSRRRLEYELTAEGYEIRGDEAVRIGVPQPDAQSDLLDRLRRWAARWSAPRIALPAQAKPRDYRDRAAQALAALATARDAGMLTAMEARLQPAKTLDTAVKRARQAAPNAAHQKATRIDAPAFEATPRFDEALAQSPPAAQPAPRVQPSDGDWANDFGKPAKPKTKNKDDWSGDFE